VHRRFSWVALTKCRCSEIVLGDPNTRYGKLLTRLTGAQKDTRNGHNKGFLRMARPGSDGRGLSFGGENIGGGRVRVSVCLFRAGIWLTAWPVPLAWNRRHAHVLARDSRTPLVGTTTGGGTGTCSPLVAGCILPGSRSEGAIDDERTTTRPLHRATQRAARRRAPGLPCGGSTRCRHYHRALRTARGRARHRPP